MVRAAVRVHSSTRPCTASIRAAKNNPYRFACRVSSASRTLSVAHVDFNPWNTTDRFRPLGNLNRARRAAYDASAAGPWSSLAAFDAAGDATVPPPDGPWSLRSLE